MTDYWMLYVVLWLHLMSGFHSEGYLMLVRFRDLMKLVIVSEAQYRSVV